MFRIYNAPVLLSIYEEFLKDDFQNNEEFKTRFHIELNEINKKLKNHIIPTNTYYIKNNDDEVDPDDENYEDIPRAKTDEICENIEKNKTRFYPYISIFKSILSNYTHVKSNVTVYDISSTTTLLLYDLDNYSSPNTISGEIDTSFNNKRWLK